MFHMIYFSIIDVKAYDLDTLPSIYITLDNIKGQGHMLQVKVKVILGIKYLQTAYISHHGVYFYTIHVQKISLWHKVCFGVIQVDMNDSRSQSKCHFSNTRPCAPYRQVPLEVYRGGPSLYGNWPTYIFVARENANVSLFLPYITCYFFAAYVLAISFNRW